MNKKFSLRLINGILILLLTSVGSFAIQKELGDLFSEIINKDSFTGKKTMAVIPFESGEGIEKDAGLTVAEYAVVSFGNSGRYNVVERSQFVKVLNELELAQSDLVDESKQIEMGKMLTADRILVGSVTESFGKRTISARIVELEKGEVIASASTVVGPAAMDDFMKELLGEKGQVSASLFRSAVVPGWGQLYTNHPIRGGVSLAAFLGVVGYSIFSWLKASNSESDYDKYEVNNRVVNETADGDVLAARLDDMCESLPSTEETTCRLNEIAVTKKVIEKKYDDFNSDFDNAVLFSAITGGVYALNLVDATFAGMSAKKKFKLYFSGLGTESLGVKVAWRF